MSGDEREPVGSVGEEAAKLLAALQGWAKESGGEYADAAAAAAAGAAGRLQDVNEHIATGGQDCTYCPVCQAIALVRSTSPEVKEHLATAASSLLQAAAGLLAGAGPAGQRARADEPGVEKIDLSDDEAWEDD
ncbi:MAG: hypothetical protein ACXVW6_01725 [Nocardioidaceae bacterium]